ncbi:hypothetical protein [Rosenbergiella collisarenosi]|uniref:hypothetical protein n=1 Tax=Rosenbergiella collisarenosi TaxID=1544695 RepID=UPI001F4E816E|nr:hypothetical protein [Rosenbergiella collisarenosi]
MNGFMCFLVGFLKGVAYNAVFLVTLVLLSLAPYLLVQHASSSVAYFGGMAYIYGFVYYYKKMNDVNRGVMRAAFVLMLSGFSGFDHGLQIFVNMYIVLDGIISIRRLIDKPRLDAYEKLVNTMNAHREIGFANEQLNKDFRRTIKYHRSVVEHYC